MERYYIISSLHRMNFLKKYGFRPFKLDLNEKNNIFFIVDKLDGQKDSLFILSEGVRSYFTFFSLNYLKNSVSILIDPVFFTKNGGLITPPYDILSAEKNTNRMILLSSKKPMTEKTVPLLELWGENYKIIDTDKITDEQLEAELDKYLYDYKIKPKEEVNVEIDEKKRDEEIKEFLSGYKKTKDDISSILGDNLPEFILDKTKGDNYKKISFKYADYKVKKKNDDGLFSI